MAYDKKISRQHPGLIVLALDDSPSMLDHLPGTSDARYLWVERYVGIILKELLARSTEVKGDAVIVKPRYYVLVILYGGSPVIWGDGVMDIQAAVERYTEAGNSLGLGGRISGTDARAATTLARDEIRGVIGQERFRDSFAPMLLHLTDGESFTDATPVAAEITQLATSDGNVLMVNAYIGTQTNLAYRGPEDFPGYADSSEAGPSEDNIRLFNMSSPVPECIQQNLIDDGVFPNLREGARLFFDVRTKEMLKHVIQVVGSMGSRADRQVS